VKIGAPSPAVTAAAALLAIITAFGTLAETLPAGLDTWPHALELSNAAILVYQPQVNRWDGNRLSFRCAIAIKPTGATKETYGVIFATARTRVNKVQRIVRLEDLKITSAKFPTVPNADKSYTHEIQSQIEAHASQISLDRLEASLAAAGFKPAPQAVRNDPPQIFVSYSPAILVPIDGLPVLQPIGDSEDFVRVINTRALIVQDVTLQSYYLHVYDGWLVADSMAGPWTRPEDSISGLDDIAAQLGSSGTVDLLTGGSPGGAKRSLADGVPAIYTPTVPSELIVFAGQPNFAPVNDTALLWATNTNSDVLIETTTNNNYVLLAGRWFRAPSLIGPWTFVASNALPVDFRNIPAGSPAAVVLPSVAGTPQAEEAIIANSIPQTARVPIAGGPSFTPEFDGDPQYAPIAGTPLQYVVNSSMPIIEVNTNSFYGLAAGVWFSAATVYGQWSVATSVPDVIYTIPTSSPVYYVTFVKVYEATETVVYEGYTPGYLGTIVEPSGTVVYGTGYAYTPWVGADWFAAPYTYGIAAAPVYNPAVGMTFGFALGLATAAWDDGNYYYPTYYGAYGCCATASANVYGSWGNTVYEGNRNWYEEPGVVGTSASGAYTNELTGTQGKYSANSSYNAYTGNATRSYDRTFQTTTGTTGNAARGTNYNTYTGQSSYGSSVSATGAGGSSIDRDTAATVGPEGYGRAAQTTTYNAQTGQSHSWSSESLDGQHYADANGNVYRGNASDGWQQRSGEGWTRAPSASSWGNGEAQARDAGAARSQAFSDFGGGAFGRGGFGDGGGFGGFGGGDRFGGGGFGGRFGGGGFRR